jgi:hypothetical protein
MKLRSLYVAIAAVTSVAVAHPVRAQRFEYAPGTSQYRLTAVNKLTQEAQGQKVEQEVTSRQKLTITLNRQGRDTLGFAMTLDSVQVSSSAGPVPDVSAVVGLRVTGALSPSGALYASKSPEGPGSELTGALADEMARFLPRLRSSLTVGATWTDTVAGKVNQAGISLDRTAIATSKVIGDTVYQGQRALRIDRSTNVKFSGSGTAQGQPITVEGTSSGTDNLFVTRDGLYLGGVLNNAAAIKFTLVASGMEIGRTQNQTTTIARVK